MPDNNNAGGKLVRLLRPSVVVLCGPAACGKSTFAERHFRPTQIISSDWARARVCDDDRDQRFNTQAFALVHFLTDQRLMLNRLCVVDSTALSVQARKELLELARKHQVPATLVCFNVPLQTCLERDEKRERTVGPAVIERQFQAFELGKSMIPQEGFDQVIELGEGDFDKVKIEILFRPAVRPGQRVPGPSGAGPRHVERPPQFSRSRPFDSSDNGHPRTSPSPSLRVSPVQAPQPAPLSRAASTTEGGLPQGKDAPTPVTVTRSPWLAPAPHPPLRADKPRILTPAAPPPRPLRSTTPRPAHVSVDSEDAS